MPASHVKIRLMTGKGMAQGSPPHTPNHKLSQSPSAQGFGDKNGKTVSFQ